MSKTITVDELGSFLDGVTKNLANPQSSEVLSEWNDVLAGDLAKGYLGSRSPAGEVYAPLKHPRPKGHNQGTQPLIDSGSLVQSVVSDGTGHIEIVIEDSTIFETSVFYAGVHQLRSKKENIPARPFMGVPDQALDTVTEMLSQHLFTIIDAI